jgi:hypothetical protein
MLRWVRAKTYSNFRAILHLFEKIAQHECKKLGFWDTQEWQISSKELTSGQNFYTGKFLDPTLYNKHKVSFE